MSRLLPAQGSLQRRLLLQLLASAALLSGLLYLSVRSVADTAAETSQDSILGAATLSVAGEIRGGNDGAQIDLPYDTFAMLGAVGDDRIFYRILVAGETATGYDALPLPDAVPQGLSPIFYSRRFEGETVRIAAVERVVLAEHRPVPVLVLVAQTQTAKAAIVAQLANRAAALGLGFFLVASVLALLTTRSVIGPVRRLAQAVERRGPQDLRPVSRPVPGELVPLVEALNRFIARLAAALARTETFIAEAAHHIRTPLATLRAQTEIALHESDAPATRASLRAILRSVDDSARATGQLLDHAAVIYRADQRSDTTIDLAALCADLVDSLRPGAELKDIALILALPDQPAQIIGDRLLIESAIRNLVDNALKYSGRDTEVEISLAATTTHARLVVRDRGRGLGGATEAHLARRFRRGDNASDVVGSGLGLTIVRDVARAHGGSFRIRDREGGGTCAELSLPLG